MLLIRWGLIGEGVLPPESPVLLASQPKRALAADSAHAPPSALIIISIAPEAGATNSGAEKREDVKMHFTYRAVALEHRFSRRDRQARKWLAELRTIKALAADRDESYRAQLAAARETIDRLNDALRDNPTHADLDAAALEINRLRTEIRMMSE